MIDLQIVLYLQYRIEAVLKYLSKLAANSYIYERLVCQRIIMFQQNLKTCMMTSSNGNIFRVTGSLYGEFTGQGESPPPPKKKKKNPKVSDAELWYFL